MREHRKTAACLGLVLAVLLAGRAFAQERIVGKALYEKLQREGRRMMAGGPTGPMMGGLQWTPDGKATYAFEDGTFTRTDIVTGEKTPLFDDGRLLSAVNARTGRQEVKLPFSRFQYVDGGRKIQFQAFNKVFIYDPASGQLVLFEPERSIVGVRGRAYGDSLSPDLKYRAFTRDYDLFVKDMDGNETALTTDGSEDLRNGFPDWVYPEELGQYQAFWWSPDSKRIAFMQFDERPVTKYPIVHDVQPIPRLEMLGYPKPGGNNPIVRLFVADVASKALVRLDTGDDLDVYHYRGQWTNDGKEFTYHRLNRLQNKVEVFAADPAAGQTRLLLADSDPCYIDESTELIFLKDSQRFLWTSERSGWREIYLYDMTGRLLKQLTNAKLPVRGVIGVDEARGWVYFSGAEANGTETHAYKVRLDGTGFAKMTKEPGSHTVAFSPTFDHYTDAFSSFDVPGKTTLFQADGKVVKVIGETAVSAELRDLKLIKPEHFLFKSADGKYDLDGLLYFPAHFDPGEKYPLILSVYGGPGFKGVNNRWNMVDGNQALAQLGFLVAVCDYRGVSGRGKAFQNLHYMKLGQIEFEDHVAFVKALGRRPYVDTARVGIFGASYGGYFSALCLLKAPDVFHVAVAASSVTDWRNYDSIYTERYMRRPQDNPDGYEKGSCLTYAKDLKGRLYLQHGAIDDNVHPGNTIQLVQALLRENKRFDLMIYPENQHGIRYPHAAETRVAYFVEHLKPVVK
ncbi:MAG TPA: DPP IV N-terminal domain-containing protein [Candidatus Aminicenantes bacterium]|nr:DPP IV N-terminal domain-containing protein [Candidatus Aminicenantes bacterium]